MSYVVGFSPHNHDLGALELACQFARSEAASVHAVTVVPQGWTTPVAGDTDRAFQQWAADQGEASAALALETLGRHPGIDVTARWVSSRSVPAALLEQARALAASILVVGSGAAGPPGRITLTSKTGRLVHSSDIPVAIAPSGYQAHGSPVHRVSIGFRDDDATWTLLERVAAICHRVGARLRVVTFAVRPRQMATTTVSHAEEQVFAQWRRQAEAGQRAAEAHLRSRGFSDVDLECTVAEGASWGEAIGALDWREGDVLAVGSSSTTARVAHVFLGSSATKIVQNSPVPVVVVP